jgi:hypothetical protein
MAGALAPRALAGVTIPSHHEQWSKVRFRIRGEEECFCSDSLKIKIAR